MPKTTTKKAPAKSGGRSFLHKLNPNTPKKKFLTFVVVFLVLGGGAMAYRSFASTGVGTYWPQQLEVSQGDARIGYSNAGLKKDTVVWKLAAQGGVRIQSNWRPVIWARQVRICASVFNFNGSPSASVQLVPTIGGRPQNSTSQWVSGNGTYQRLCSSFVSHTDPNQVIGGEVKNNEKQRSGSPIIHVGNIEIEAQ